MTEKKQTHRYRGQTSDHLYGERSGEGQYWRRGLRGRNYYVLNKIQRYIV